MKPELKQFGALTQADFDHFPIWVSVHTMDYDEPWYEETDEETFRPWINDIPVDPSLGMFLIRSELTLADSSKLVGFITPAFGEGEVADTDLGIVQPHMFNSSGGLVSFWGGIFGIPEETKKAIYEVLGRTSTQVFPISFIADTGLTSGRQTGKIRGFCKLVDMRSGQIEFSV